MLTSILPSPRETKNLTSVECFNSPSGMSFPSAFSAQVAAIMDALAKAAAAEISMLLEEGSVALRLEVSRRDSEIQELRSSLKRMDAELQKAQEAAARRVTAEKQVQTQEPWREIKEHETDGAYPEEQPAASLCEPHISPAVKQEVELHFDETAEHAARDAANGGDPIWPVCDVFENSSVALQQQIFPSNVEEYPSSRDVQSSYPSSATEGADDCFTLPIKAEISALPESGYTDTLHGGVIQGGCMESAGPSAALPHAQESTAGASEANEENINNKINGRPKRLMTAWRANQSVYICSVCNKGFLRLSQLEEHKSSHQSSKPFRCLECGKSFTQKTRLKTHQRVHTGERPFSCSICGKRFSRQDNCMRHERFHSGLKPFSCRQCGKSFTVLGNLKIHQVIHLRGR
ncbi:gastrula zinc finger protein 5-1-like isoform X1 [Cyprinodon tularosa]|uniref:gastrula zinc finger protein 5-1-like isoform X1 n=1 Tax=Cyprinodon tularosa TaxID=77115 RepID=UPI0018E268A7|nr:gastrula zinc finger protein 5-1-like isoform X1 [Cyprinodon tularosa]